MRAFRSRRLRRGRDGQASPAMVSRRQFLTYAAIGAGSLSLGGLPTFAAEPTSIASACSSTKFFLPQLEIQHGPKGKGGFLASPDIWATEVPDVNAPPVTELDFTRTYFVVTRIHNRGTAPVFNATVNFHHACTLCFPLGSFVPGAFLRTGAIALDTQYVSIESRSDRRVVCPVPFGFFIHGTALIVECFDPLTDPPAPPFDFFNFGSDRHVAARGL